jgi:hypothetical protein
VLIAPPKNVPASDVFRALLAPDPAWSIAWSIGGVRFFVRPLGSFDWVRLHRAILEADGARRLDAENELVAAVVVDERGERAFDRGEDVGNLYQPEARGLGDAVSLGLSTISPTFVGADVVEWMNFLREGALAPENLSDALSLGGCADVSWGFAKGAVHVRHEPESFYGCPRRRLVDAQWLAYHAARGVHAEANRR